MIALKCPTCKKVCAVMEEHAGTTIICTHCQRSTEVPSLMASAVPSNRTPTEGESRNDSDTENETTGVAKPVWSVHWLRDAASSVLWIGFLLTVNFQNPTVAMGLGILFLVVR